MDGRGAHVIVVGNEKGGSGKSTTAFHLATALLYKGYRVATMDVDSRQQTFTNYVKNRRRWAEAQGVSLPNTLHFHLPRPRGDSIRENQKYEFELFGAAIAEVEDSVDFVLIDTPGFDTNLARLAHSMADTLVTPVNDSLVDLDVIVRFDPATGEARDLGQYARLVQRARSERLAVDGHTVDWVLVRNRVSMLASRNSRTVQGVLDKVAMKLGCRVADGIAERVIFRSLFPYGLTVFDPLDETILGGLPPMSHITARQEYRLLLDSLNLPSRKLAPIDGQRLEGAANDVRPVEAQIA
ncbi:division plane positioning ATPase MipZ [Paradevosia shaoguanensis]|uniref:Division plane positioning ATPase MipZ n=1 Tax=Paradevosia shaoguanensis TaxID=1335043 RepID=A0AA41QM39_9HYPH|nr:division plane positioning ATPase MipZ [Paradevosia shaoguanensis]MCF1742913.1 division plane positioning ATPase MipZ [Paradevosia shaoguanensis]MCI0127396.1 division plane positioning ATPase MipZ [Paradevosia shaoguanensis]